MAMDLLDFLTKGLGSDFASKAAGLLGESAPTTQKALDAALPTLLAGLTRKAVTPDGASDIFGLINRLGTDPSQLANIGGLLSGGNLNTLTSAGGSILSALFGDRAGGLGNALAGLAGIKPNSASTMLSAVAPLALGMLRGHASKEGLGASGLANLLLSNRESLTRLVPDGIAKALGWGAPSTWFASAAPVAPAPVQEERRSGLGRWIPWIIGAALALWLLSMLSRCGQEPAATSTAPEPPAPTAPAPEPVPAPVAAADTVKLYFDVGSATPGVEAGQQLSAIAEYAKSTGARLAVSGYHDPSGDAATNEALARGRAEAVRDVLLGLGVPEAGIELDKPFITEGGGEERESRRVEVSVRP
jgi:hypothetical protein